MLAFSHILNVPDQINTHPHKFLKCLHLDPILNWIAQKHTTGTVLLVFFLCDYLSSVSQESILPFICTLIHTGAVADPVNFSVAVKHLKKNYCHMLMFYLPLSPLLSFTPLLSLCLSISLTQGILQELYPSLPRRSICQWETLAPSSLITCPRWCVWLCVCVCVRVCARLRA